MLLISKKIGSEKDYESIFSIKLDNNKIYIKNISSVAKYSNQIEIASKRKSMKK